MEKMIREVDVGAAFLSTFTLHYSGIGKGPGVFSRPHRVFLFILEGLIHQEGHQFVRLLFNKF